MLLCIINSSGSALMNCSKVFSRFLSCMKKLHPYTPPAWAAQLPDLPRYYVKLANKCTPIQEWKLSEVPSPFTIHIKRDDMTGSTLSGNKVRKLEFLLADALDKKCDTIITCGGIQSNHCRATAVAARELGLNSFLLLRYPEKHTNIGCLGNLLLDRMVGSHIILVPKEPYATGLKPRMEKLAQKLKESDGCNPYLVPIGGSNYLGMMGYLEVFNEMMKQNILEDYDDIIMATGSAGTASGVAIGNYLTGCKLRVHAVCVCDTSSYFYEHIDEDLRQAGLNVKARDIIDVIDGYKGEGYGISTDEELADVLKISTTTGIFLDPIYNIKAVRGMLSQIRINPTRFKGHRILYLHTGGVFGLYDGRVESIVNATSATNNVQLWSDLKDDPPL